MKKIFLLCLITQSLWAQLTPVQSKVENVTVFLNGAHVTRSAKVSLSIGKTELVFKGISPQINKQSIQVKSENKFSILSVNHQLGSLLDLSQQEEINKINTQKQPLEDKLTIEKTNLLVFKREEEILLKNQPVGGPQSGVRVADLKDNVEYQRQRMLEVLLKKFEFEKNIQRLEGELQKLNQQLTALNAKSDTQMSEIIVTVLTKEPITDAHLSISYFVRDAGWKPTYDFKIEKLSQPMRLVYKANVYQYSGEDWKEVKLALSTGNPFKSGVAPVLRTWVLGQKNDYSEYYNNINQEDNFDVVNENTSQVRGLVTARGDRTGIPGASVMIKGTTLRTATDPNGNYRLTIPPTLFGKRVTLIFSMIGFKSLEKNVSSNLVDVILEEDARSLSEVIVTGYGSGRAPGLEVSSDKETAKRTIPLDISEKEAPTSQSFDILIPYTVPSDGKVYTVEIKEESIPAVFEHFCIPKIDTDVFLQARIANWEQYKLMPGEASLFIDNTFLGKSKLNLSNKDMLNLSFGRDKNVIVSRVLLKSFQKRQFIGNNVSDQFTYEIKARNIKSEQINLIIEDQFPVANSKEVSVDDKEAQGAEINNTSGEIKWRINLAPAKEQELRMKYTIKSPKSGWIMAE